MNLTPQEQIITNDILKNPPLDRRLLRALLRGTTKDEVPFIINDGMEVVSAMRGGVGEADVAEIQSVVQPSALCLRERPIQTTRLAILYAVWRAMGVLKGQTGEWSQETEEAQGINVVTSTCQDVRGLGLRIVSEYFDGMDAPFRCESDLGKLIEPDSRVVGVHFNYDQGGPVDRDTVFDPRHGRRMTIKDGLSWAEGMRSVKNR
ncbi:MAG: hypothetical protein ACD_51C00028G0026 [uncultured bacterium]|nr:MAG: hypothetical protein ACD_51C00028G0026 [uncultured bacterium]OGJ47890.1 MAG: hypothetical protein A2244_05425 [Candidatus Peregrinibacteria bacterium RIFOXYA2_FULL_41_18]OGJ49132.1 MAG: hypothetical protein A2344_00990 [Candidatus Peregrinibacteria bacterium RIFOXYB12_FULL_41_12]